MVRQQSRQGTLKQYNKYSKQVVQYGSTAEQAGKTKQYNKRVKQESRAGSVEQNFSSIVTTTE